MPFVAASILTIVAIAVVLWVSWDYYQLSWEDRFDAPLHKRLRSSGEIGHLYGNVGLLLIFGNLLYLVRRRLVSVTWLGSMRAWMSLHVFTGIVGPAFVLLHSAFTLRTWPAMVSAGSLVIVVATGIFGRYLYQLVPRLASGRQAAAEELAGDVDRAVMELRAIGRGGNEAAELVDRRVDAEVTAAGGHDRTGLGAIVRALRVLWHLRALRGAARDAALAAGATASEARTIGRSAAAVGRAIVRLELIDVLAHAATAWRGLHRNLVVVMLLAASLHVSIAIYLGFGL